jgi:BASS family bile acid:Na+ symporter
MHGHRLALIILSWVYLVSVMFGLGLELGGTKESKDKKKAQRHLLVRGLSLNLIILPAIAFAIVRALHASDDVTVALLLLVSAPGARFAPQLVRLGGGNTALGVEVTLFLAKITGFTAAPVAKWLLTQRSIEVRELPFLLQLVLLQLAPFFLGKWARRKRPSFAERAIRPTFAVAITIALVLLGIVLVKSDRAVLDVLHERGWLAVLALGLISPVLGWFAGGSHDQDRRALAIGANSSELPLALAIASSAFPMHGVHTALFGTWTLLALASLFLALGMRTFGARRSEGVRSGPPGPFQNRTGGAGGPRPDAPSPALRRASHSRLP